MKRRVFYSLIVSALMIVLVSTAALAQETGLSLIDDEDFFTEELSAEDPETILAEDTDDILSEYTDSLDFEAHEPYDDAVTMPDAVEAEWSEDEEAEVPKADNPVIESEDLSVSEEMTGASYCGANATWEYFDGMLTISGKGAIYDYDGVDNRPPWYSIRSKIKTVFVEDGITGIGSYAFGYLNSLMGVCLPSSVEKIGHASFCYCTSLKAVEIPSGVKTIDTSAFYGSTSVIRVSFLGAAPSIKGMAFGNVTAIAYYLSGNTSWTASARQNYGGSLTWTSVTSYYDVWLCSIRVNSANKNDILGDGGKAKYNSSSKTLTLNSPKIMKAAYMNRSNHAPISAVIYVSGNLTIQGTVAIRSEQTFNADIFVEGNLTINNGDIVLSKLYVTGDIYCKGTKMIAFSISGTSGIDIVDSSEVYSDYLTSLFGTITIADSYVWVTNDNSTAYDDSILCQGCEITNSKVRAVSAACNAISAYNTFIIQDSELTVEGAGAGVYSCGIDIRKGNTITAQGATGALYGVPDFGEATFKIVPGYVFVEPASATVRNDGILSNGKYATRVVLRPLTSSDKAGLYYKNAAANSVTIPTKSSAQLQLKTKDGYLVTGKWTSGNADVASVNQEGLVKANKYGKTKISCNTGSTTLTCDAQTLFYDVTDPKQTGYKQIYWGVDKGIIAGFGGVYFGPELPCTRQQFAVMIWRAKGRPAASGSLSFSDMKSLSTTSDSYKAVLWAVKKGVIKGYSNNTFRPNNNITRESIVIMLWRLAGQPKATKPLAFKDTKTLNKTSTAYKAIAWASEAGIVKGFSDNTFRKDENSKRNQIIIMIYRFVNR